MNITIFGGTGKTGQILIRKALDKGYVVKVYARNPAKISIDNDNLEIVKGDLNDYQEVAGAIRHADAVISLLGPMAKECGKGLPIFVGTHNIVNAMVHHKISRLIATSTPSFKVEGDKFQFSFCFRRFIVKAFLNNSYQNIVQSAMLVQKSELDWTIVRLAMLNDNPGKGKVFTGYRGDGKVKLFSLSRTDLADFLLDQIEDERFIRKAPIVSN